MRLRLVSGLLLTVGLLSSAPAHAVGSRTASVPVLGDPLTLWTATYGPFLTGANRRTPGWFPCGTHDARWQVMVSPRADHVFAVSGASCRGTAPATLTRVMRARQHMPADAVWLGTYTSDRRAILMYYSATLARESAFLAGDFRDCRQHLVRRGTFSLSRAGSSASDWTLQLGTCA